MKRLVLIVIALSFSCSPNPENYLEHVTGYWEIEEVIFSDGNKKSYKYNESIDYISINDSLLGFRKKLQPGFNSKYVTSEDAEGITVKIENDSLNLYYKTPFANWKETVLMADEKQMKIINDRATIYVYKRFKPVALDLN
jgi:hypothetical protein